jgi:hypothetical protein
MRTPSDMLAWMAHEAAHPTADWSGYCERLARTAYGLGAVYATATEHFLDVPAQYRHGHSTPPPAGAHLIFRNNGAGHIVTATGHNWEVYTNDSPSRRGRVHLVADGRTLASWCHATDWYAADPYFQGQKHILRWGGSSANVSANFPGTIRPGARGNAVRTWQNEMIRHHFIADNSANRDGYYGPGMERAVRSMQGQLHVPVDGICGNVTWQALVARH